MHWVLTRVTQPCAAALVFFLAYVMFFSCVLLFDSISSSALASLADDVIPIDTGAARWDSQTFLAQVPHELMEAG